MPWPSLQRSPLAAAKATRLVGLPLWAWLTACGHIPAADPRLAPPPWPARSPPLVVPTHPSPPPAPTGEAPVPPLKPELLPEGTPPPHTSPPSR